MQIKSILAATAIALAAAVGSASAADRLTTMEGMEAKALTPLEMAAVFGAFDLNVNPPIAGAVLNPPDALPHLGLPIGGGVEPDGGLDVVIGLDGPPGPLPVVDIMP